MSDVEIQIIQAKLKSLKCYLSRAANNVERNIAGKSISELQERANELKQIFSEFSDLNNKLFALDVFHNEEDFNNQFLPYEEKYYATLSKFLEKIRNSENIHNPVNGGNAIHHNTNDISIHLPKTMLPTFSGDFSEWISFQDLFTSAVGEKEGISGAQKMQYLRMSCKGEALSLITNLKITNANYDIAWKKLTDRYNKPRMILRELLKRFLEVNSTSKSSDLRHALNEWDEILRAVDNLGDYGKSRDPWIMYLILERLDKQTKQAWADESVEDAEPSLSELLEFLQSRCDSIEYNSEKTIYVSNESSNSTKGISAQEQKCKLCKENHFLYHCSQFKQLSPQERESKIVSFRLCKNCFRAGHDQSSCRSNSRCQKCSKKHHTLIHDEAKLSIKANLGSNP